MNDKIFQKIFNVLRECVQGEWDKIVFRADYSEGSYSMKFWIKKQEEYQDCFDLEYLTDMQLIAIFMDLDEVLSKDRENMHEKWSVMTIVFDYQRQFEAEYSYEDLSEKRMSFMEEWESKYLI